MFENKDMCVIDIETTSLDVNEARVVWFGMYSYLHNEYYLLPFKGNEKEIKKLIFEHKIIVGFNHKGFDIPILKNNYNDDQMFDYKVLIDLLEISAPKGGKDYAKNRKNRLAQMGIKLKSFSLKNIIEALKLDEEGSKGDIDYKIFQKDEWSIEEIIEIKKYLKQDIDLTKKLLEWYEKQFSPLKKFLPEKEQNNLLYIKSTLSVLAYHIICNKAGLKPDFGESVDVESFAGGHHIEPRWELVKGNIICLDFTSMYPHCIIMGNLHTRSPDFQNGWSGDYFYNIEGEYDNEKQGKVEETLKELLNERLKAKKNGEKEKDKSYKLVINSAYGLFGNPTFKSLYNRSTASDCTSIARTILKKMCKHLDVNGFQILSGFTDSIYILIPNGLDKKILMFLVDVYIREVKSHFPFPCDTFNMAIEEEIKMMWFVAKNCYLYVTNNNEVKYKSTLLNTNTPKAVMKLFKEYMTPIIIDKLDIPFTKNELEAQLKIILEKEPELSAQEYKVGELNEYKVKTSLHYQISDRYGSGRHYLIPNKQGIGVGLGKSTKKVKGIRHCNMDEFKEKNLKTNDIDLKHLLSHLKPFYERNEKKNNEKKDKQRTL